MKFKTGDRIRYVNGAKKIVVTHVTKDFMGEEYVEGFYASSRSKVRKKASYFVFWDESKNTLEAEAKTLKNKLFETKSEPKRYGTYLATNSQGEYVLEMKDKGTVETFAVADVEGVMPYTFAVKYFDGGNTYHYLGSPGCVKEGDLLLPTMNPTNGRNAPNLCLVVAVNTKAEQ